MEEPENSKMHDYDVTEIKELLFHEDNLLHNRVSSLLLTETIFFILVVTIWTEPLVVSIFSFISIILTLLFGLTIFKLHLRVSWLMARYKELSPLLADYLSIKGYDPSNHGKITKWVFKITTADKPNELLVTGFLYSVGLTFIFSAAWIFIFINSLIRVLQHC